MGKVVMMNDSALTDDEALRVVASIPITVLDNLRKNNAIVTCPADKVNVRLQAYGSGDRTYLVVDRVEESSVLDPRKEAH